MSYKHFANTTDTIYGNGLPRDAQVKQVWEAAICTIKGGSSNISQLTFLT